MSGSILFVASVKMAAGPSGVRLSASAGRAIHGDQTRGRLSVRST